MFRYLDRSSSWLRNEKPGFSLLHVLRAIRIQIVVQARAQGLADPRSSCVTPALLPLQMPEIGPWNIKVMVQKFHCQPICATTCRLHYEISLYRIVISMCALFWILLNVSWVSPFRVECMGAALECSEKYQRIWLSYSSMAEKGIAIVFSIPPVTRRIAIVCFLCGFFSGSALNWAIIRLLPQSQ